MSVIFHIMVSDATIGGTGGIVMFPVVLMPEEAVRLGNLVEAASTSDEGNFIFKSQHGLVIDARVVVGLAPLLDDEGELDGIDVDEVLSSDDDSDEGPKTKTDWEQ